MSETKVHRGSCHCQAIVFSVKTPATLDPARCDCSHCAKHGVIWGHVQPGDLILEKGKGKLSEYAYGDKTVKQLSCGTCGTFIARGKSGSSWPDGEDRVLFNIRAIRDIDLNDLDPYIKFHKRDLPPLYHPAPPLSYTFPPPTSDTSNTSDTSKPNEAHDAEMKIYHGSCHCQSVKFLLRSKPLGRKDVDVNNCNCSICGGNGAVWAYPIHADVHISPSSTSHLTRYTFTPPSPSQNQFFFCSTCFVTVYEDREGSDGMGLNVRLIEWDEGEGKGGEKGEKGLEKGMEAEEVSVKVDDRSTEPQYVLP